jgi:hypothetical protein
MTISSVLYFFEARTHRPWHDAQGHIMSEDTPTRRPKSTVTSRAKIGAEGEYTRSKVWTRR